MEGLNVDSSQSMLESDTFDKELDLLKQAVINEKAAPVILQYERDLVMDLLEQLENQEEGVAEVYSETTTHLFIAQLIVMELARIKFLLKTYLRTRLWKIEKNALYIAQRPELIERLSAQERNYLNKHAQLVENHMKATVFEPITRQHGTTFSTPIHAPDLDRYVYCLFTDDVPNYEVEGQLLTFERHSLYILRYQTAEPICNAGKAVYY